MNKIKDRLWLPEDCKSVVCALSGGADSVCLLHAMLEYAKGRDIKVCAAHFNHKIRGEEADSDADFCKKLCESLKIPYRIGEGDVPEYAREMHLGTEEAARRMRYAFLDAAAMVLDCKYIATAHNADDNAETVVFNLTRGAGGKGLRGIPRRRGNIIRPLLYIPRSDIEEYLVGNAFEHVEDSSNAGNDYTRNVIRHSIMPVLRRLNPNFTAAVGRTGELLAQDEDYLSQQAQMYIDDYYNGESFPADILAKTHPAIASRIVRTIVGRDLESVHVRMILDLSRGEGLGWADIPGARIRRERGKIYFTGGKSCFIQERVLAIGSSVDIPEVGQKISAQETIFDGLVNDSLNTYYLNCEKIQNTLVISGRRNGDRFAPTGRGCTKTLKSLFAEKKLTVFEKDSVLVIRDANGIAAVAGFGKDKRFDCIPGGRAVKITIEKI